MINLHLDPTSSSFCGERIASHSPVCGIEVSRAVYETLAHAHDMRDSNRTQHSGVTSMITDPELIQWSLLKRRDAQITEVQEGQNPRREPIKSLVIKPDASFMCRCTSSLLFIDQ